MCMTRTTAVETDVANNWEASEPLSSRVVIYIVRMSFK